MKEPEGPALIWCPFPDAATAAATAKLLLDERLVACANILPAMLSLFEWNGERGEASEAGTLFKTDAAFLGRAIARLAELHPYDEPAILGWRAGAATPGSGVAGRAFALGGIILPLRKQAEKLDLNAVLNDWAAFRGAAQAILHEIL